MSKLAYPISPSNIALKLTIGNRIAGPFLLSLLITLFIDVAQGKASIPIKGKQVTNSRFWVNIHPIGTIEYPGCPDDSFSNKTRFLYYLYRDKEDDWYLMGNGNGQIWKLDSSKYWIRLDNSFFIGYDYHNYLLYHGLKYGGYGFWKANGMLFNYREKNGEWELIKLSREIPALGMYCYYDLKRNILMQCGAYYINDANMLSRVAIDSLFELDLFNREWKGIGRLNSKASFFLTPAQMLKSLETTTGKWMFSPLGDTCAFINYMNKICYIPNKTIQDAFEIKYQNVIKGSSMLVATKTAILFVDVTKYHIEDSLQWCEILQNPAYVYPMLQLNKTADWSTSIALLVSLGGIGIAIIFYKHRNTKLKTFNPKEIEPEINIISNNGYFLIEQNGVIMFNGQDLKDILQNQEISLLRILIEKKINGESLNTIQFNELIGIDNRSPDNQKKIRSETVKAINSGIHNLGFPFEAISRVRHEEDRRMMMYFLNEEITVNKIDVC